MDTFFNVNLVKTLFIDFSCKIRNTVAAKKAPLLAYKKYGKNRQCKQKYCFVFQRIA